MCVHTHGSPGPGPAGAAGRRGGRGICPGDSLNECRTRATRGIVHAWVGQIVTFFAYSPPSRPLGSLTPTQPGRVIPLVP